MKEVRKHLHQQHCDAEQMLTELTAAVRLLRGTGLNGSDALRALSGCRVAIQGEVDLLVGVAAATRSAQGPEETW